MEELRRLEQASLAFEKGKDPYEEKWFRNLLAPGSSLGGARPKANVVDPEGSIWIAKFPSRHDEENIRAWEMTAHELARLCGIQVPPAKLMHFSDAGDTFLVKRYDRERKNGLEKRIHFASAMTMLGETDGTDNPVGYLDLAQAIEEMGARPEHDLRELWHRLVFYILVSNADDHLRNHGFLLSEDGWHLSPAYDINPTYDSEYLSLLITTDDNSKDIRLAREVACFFRMEDEEALSVIRRDQMLIKDNWRKLASRYHIPKGSQDRMEQAFEECDREI